MPPPDNRRRQVLLRIVFFFCVCEKVEPLLKILSDKCQSLYFLIFNTHFNFPYLRVSGVRYSLKGGSQTQTRAASAEMLLVLRKPRRISDLSSYFSSGCNIIRHKILLHCLCSGALSPWHLVVIGSFPLDHCTVCATSFANILPTLWSRFRFFFFPLVEKLKIGVFEAGRTDEIG